MGELDQGEREGAVEAFRAEREGPGASRVREGLRDVERGGDEVGAERALGADQFDEGGGDVDLLRLVGDGLGRDVDAEAGAGGGEGGRGGAVRARAQAGVGVKGFGDDAEGQGGVLDLGLAAEGGVGDGDDGVERGVGGVDDGEFVELVALGVGLGLVVIEAHEILLLPETGEQLADEQQDEAEVGEDYPGLSPDELEAADVAGEEVEQQEAADEVAAGEERQRHAAKFLEDDKGAKPLLLDAPDAEVGLVEGGGEDQQDGEREQRDGEAERHEQIAEVAEDFSHGRRGAGAAGWRGRRGGSTSRL